MGEDGVADASVELGPCHCNAEEDAGLKAVSPMFDEMLELGDSLLSDKGAEAPTTQAGGPKRMDRWVLQLKPHFEKWAGRDLDSRVASSVGLKWQTGRG